MPLGTNQIQMNKTDGVSVFKIVIRDKLDKHDFEEFVPQLEWQITKAGKINLVVELADFHGWTLGAFWEDFKFSVKHFDDIDKIAIVGGGKPWERGMTSLYKPFTRAKVRFFNAHEHRAAWEWASAAAPP